MLYNLLFTQASCAQHAAQVACKAAPCRPHVHRWSIAGAAKEQLRRPVPVCKDLHCSYKHSIITLHLINRVVSP